LLQEPTTTTSASRLGALKLTAGLRTETYRENHFRYFRFVQFFFSLDVSLFTQSCLTSYDRQGVARAAHCIAHAELFSAA